jgi:EAL domain-containing protein (putative c-di-GMP-specific phosphodiesterase class I)
VTNPVSDNSRLRVLVIDDQRIVRTWVRHVLNMAGITEVTDAADGRDALAAVTEPGGWFDLIICDLRMPERDGIETIRAFAALGLESAIAILSVEDERVIETAGMLASAQGLRILGTIAKPLTAEKLAPILERLRELPSDPPADASVSPELDFRGAFEHNELYFVYQPKISMHSGTFVGIEALVRWKNPDLGLLLPASFLSAMEAHEPHNGALTNLALRENIAFAGRWHRAGRSVGISINLSARALDRLDLPERIESLARDAHVPPEFITIEIAEAQLAPRAIKEIDIATRLRLKGFRLSVDDFGNATPGLLNLQKLPFNELKIARSVVDGCATSSAKRSVVESAIALARSVNMSAVAMGVQHRADWDVLKELDCGMMQGFFVARPMTEEGLDAWAAQWELHQRVETSSGGILR